MKAQIAGDEFLAGYYEMQAEQKDGTKIRIGMRIADPVTGAPIEEGEHRLDVPCEFRFGDYDYRYSFQIAHEGLFQEFKKSFGWKDAPTP